MLVKASVTDACRKKQKKHPKISFRKKVFFYIFLLVGAKYEGPQKIIHTGTGKTIPKVSYSWFLEAEPLNTYLCLPACLSQICEDDICAFL